MDNLEIRFPLEDGSEFTLDPPTGEDFIHDVACDDWGPPPRCMVISAKTREGRTVEISIPYSRTGAASAHIRDEDD